ncbi:hypothetical protein RFI_36068 [Reticulomyxa filosa]|uniref:Uncharacterized protein n=1 Tax=Reticulomyxa filosa TaxID=46433 RepID=X6LJT2_RETFI|nr:hypothetical protein RFI_36068 [Reticulomyxa filosa]|eukprot:ETO01372.1 hypothetical protein RFI_36068 [Reticulomyxa filosa]
MAQAATTMKLGELLKKIVENDIFREKINKKAYKMNVAGSVDKGLSGRISRDCVKIIFSDEKKWEQSDDCSNNEIAGDNLNNLPVILKHLWANVVRNTEKEVKNAHILNAAKTILDAILRREIYITSECTVSSVKSTSNQRVPSTVFPDLLLSLTNKTCLKAEPKSPFIVIDYKLPGKLKIFDRDKDELNRIWNKRGSVHIAIKKGLIMTTKKISKFILLDPVLQIAGYMIWSVARIGMLLAYPYAVWFEIGEINEDTKVFNIEVYTLLKMTSFENGMLEIVRILKYASKINPNKKFFRGKVIKYDEETEDEEEAEFDEAELYEEAEAKEEAELGDEVEVEEEADAEDEKKTYKVVSKRKRKLSQMKSENEEISKQKNGTNKMKRTYNFAKFFVQWADFN